MNQLQRDSPAVYTAILLTVRVTALVGDEPLPLIDVRCNADRFPSNAGCTPAVPLAAVTDASLARRSLRHAVVVCSAVAFFSPGAPAAQSVKPIIDNERVAVWKVSGGDPMRPPPTSGESIEISLGSSAGAVVLRKKGDARQTPPPAVVVELKDHPMTPRINGSGYPNAFPRPRARKLLETGRVLVWDYSWTRGQPTPMHYHDKDVVVVFLDNGTLRSKTPTGQETSNDYKAGDIRFTVGDRVHSEDLATGDQRAIIVELK